MNKARDFVKVLLFCFLSDSFTKHFEKHIFAHFNNCVWNRWTYRRMNGRTDQHLNGQTYKNGKRLMTQSFLKRTYAMPFLNFPYVNLQQKYLKHDFLHIFRFYLKKNECKIYFCQNIIRFFQKNNLTREKIHNICFTAFFSHSERQ